ncbi:hypothetical protein BDQ17DRAFT_1322107 [Cyathus striatus]|nr:hypothetical protein BDQ17DRAFT_1322107 [Cyathus striatus]
MFLKVCHNSGWIMSAFNECAYGAFLEPGAAPSGMELYERAIELLEWGCWHWNNVSKQDLGEIFEKVLLEKLNICIVIYDAYAITTQKDLHIGYQAEAHSMLGGYIRLEFAANNEEDKDKEHCTTYLRGALEVLCHCQDEANLGEVSWMASSRQKSTASSGLRTGGIRRILEGSLTLYDIYVPEFEFIWR